MVVLFHRNGEPRETKPRMSVKEEYFLRFRGVPLERGAIRLDLQFESATGLLETHPLIADLQNSNFFYEQT